MKKLCLLLVFVILSLGSFSQSLNDKCDTLYSNINVRKLEYMESMKDLMYYTKIEVDGESTLYYNYTEYKSPYNSELSSYEKNVHISNKDTKIFICKDYVEYAIRKSAYNYSRYIKDINDYIENQLVIKYIVVSDGITKITTPNYTYILYDREDADIYYLFITEKRNVYSITPLL